MIINRMGDLLVRPRALEHSLRLMPFSGSLKQHLLTSYVHSILAVFMAQFKPRAGGKADMQSVLELIKSSNFLKVSQDILNHMAECFAACSQ